MALYGPTLVRVDDYFTFEFLSEAKDYSILGNPYLGATATETFEGRPWEVMEANGLVYDFTQNALVQISTIMQRVALNETRKYFVPSGLILAGSIDEDGNKISGYSGFFLAGSKKFKYSEVTFV